MQASRHADRNSTCLAGVDAFTALGSNCLSAMKNPGRSAHARYENPSNASPTPIEYCVATKPMSSGDTVDPIRPMLYAAPTAVPRTTAGKLSLMYVPFTAYGAP